MSKYNIYIIIIGNFLKSEKNFFLNSIYQKKIVYNLEKIEFNEVILGYSLRSYDIFKIINKLSYRSISYFVDCWVKVRGNLNLINLMNISNKIICNDSLMKNQIIDNTNKKNSNVFFLKSFNRNKHEIKKKKLYIFLWPSFFLNKNKLNLFSNFLSKIKDYEIFLKHHPSFSQKEINQTKNLCKLNRFTFIERLDKKKLKNSILIAHFSSVLISYSLKNNQSVNFSFYKNKNEFGWNDINIYSYYSIKYAKTFRDLLFIIKNEK